LSLNSVRHNFRILPNRRHLPKRLLCCQGLRLDPKILVTNTTTLCPTDSCTYSVCDPVLGCNIINQTSLAQCTSLPSACSSAYLNPTSTSCCAYYNPCVATTPCVTVGCNATSQACTSTPYCSTFKCLNPPTCTVINSNAVCTYTNRTDCVPASVCEVVADCVEDGQPYACVKNPLCTTNNTDPCWTVVCNIDTNGNPSCDQVPALNCDDLDLCTVDTCSNGTCHHQDCITTDLCTPNVCNVSVGCQLTPILCNDNNYCTVDTCINGTCNFDTLVQCDTSDFCNPGVCHSTTGCVYTARNCLLNDTCYSNSGTGSSTVKQYSPCYSILGCTSLTTCNPGTCDVYVCQNNTCQYTIRGCPSALSATAIIAGSLAGGIIAAIIVAAVVCAGLCGGGVYAVYSAANNENQAEAFNNPLFRGLGQAFDNPIHKT